MNERTERIGLVITGNLLVFWTLGYVGFWLAQALPGVQLAGLLGALFFPWLIGVIVLTVLYIVQR